MKRKQLQNLMKQARMMQEQMADEMEQLRVEASSGGAAVKVCMNGEKKLLSLEIQPEAVDPEDVEMLQDLIIAAVNEASKKIDEGMSSRLGNLPGGLLGL
ncbi:MAG: YbaB/EbfC family nucleoid-associated protein [Acidobacteriota bacterium]